MVFYNNICSVVFLTNKIIVNSIVLKTLTHVCVFDYPTILHELTFLNIKLTLILFVRKTTLQILL